MKVISEDILKMKNGIICHSVNSLGVWGSGLALQLKNKWPHAYQEYKDKLLMPRYKNLGRAQIVKVSDSLYCCNLYSQLDYGTDYRRTEYGSLYTSLKNLKEQIDDEDLVYFPWQLASGRGGADWNLVMEMIDELFPVCCICKID